MKRIVLFYCLALLLSSALEAGTINVQNGSYSVYFFDIKMKGTPEIIIDRYYNSKLIYDGFFGQGWVSNLEEKVKGFGKDGMTVEKAPALGTNFSLLPATAISSLKDKYQIKGEILNVFRASRGEEILAKVKVPEEKDYFWLRIAPDKKRQIFDAKNRLVKSYDANNNYLKYQYNDKGQLIQIADASNRQLNISYYPQGKIKTIRDPQGKIAEYKYDELGNLIESKDVANNVYNYKYGERYNLETLTYSAENGKRKKEIMKYGYGDKNLIISHSGPGEVLTRYQYQFDPQSPKRYQHYKVSVIKTFGNEVKGRKTAPLIDNYEYWFKARDDGGKYLDKIATVLDGVKTTTSYNECCGQPLTIERGGQLTKFEYYGQSGLLKKKITPNQDVTELYYKEGTNLISEVVTYNLQIPKDRDISSYQYDLKGNLYLAKNQKRKTIVRLKYDYRGRITTLLDQAGRIISFQYNEYGKPIEITQKGVGAITVSYDAEGNIKDVKSSAGTKVAIQVTSAFQNLLEILAPAGVTFSM